MTAGILKILQGFLYFHEGLEFQLFCVMLIFPSIASVHWAACFPAAQGLGMMSENVNYGERSGITQGLVCSPSRQHLKERICFPSSVPEHQ